MSESDLLAVWITLKLASLTTLILLILGTPLAWWLARSRFRFKMFVEAVVALPLVLPPTVLGFYLLVFMGPQGPLGEALNFLGIRPLAFTFTGLVVASVLYSLPFVVQPIQNAFETRGARSLEVAATLRANGSRYLPWIHLNDVAGFIGPEVFRTREQLVRCCLEDIVMGKLHGLCLGLDVCSTLHMASLAGS